MGGGKVGVAIDCWVAWDKFGGKVGGVSIAWLIWRKEVGSVLGSSGEGCPACNGFEGGGAEDGMDGIVEDVSPGD